MNDIKIYLRHLEDAMFARVDAILGYPLEKKNFRKSLGYELNLENPVSFNQKICWKKLFDRNPLLPILADKYTMREHIVKVLGVDEANQIMIPLLVVTEDPETLDFDQLPNSFAVKSNHGSGNNILVQNKHEADRRAIIEKCKFWLKMRYGVRAHEWAYQNTPRKILVEVMLKNREGQVPPDYKFSMIHGKCAFIQVDCDRFGDFTRTLYDEKWNMINVEWKRKQGRAVAKPAQLNKMIELAEKLSRDLDYIRIDFYVQDEKIFLGEMTNYPARGRGKFNPQSYDFELGTRWNFDPDYWKNSTASNN